MEQQEQVLTTKGLVNRDQLVINCGEDVTPTAKAKWTEYRLDGELVRRDVAIALFV